MTSNRLRRVEMARSDRRVSAMPVIVLTCIATAFGAEEAPVNYFTQYARPSEGSYPQFVGRFDLKPADVSAVPDGVSKPKKSRPNVYSGLALGITGPDQPLTFIGISDRGPVKDCRDADVCGKGFPWPEYSPTLYQLHIIEPSKVVIANACPLRYGAAAQEVQPAHLMPVATLDRSELPQAQEPNDLKAALPSESDRALSSHWKPAWVEDGVTGLPNTENDDVPFNADCSARLDLNPNGIDSEDLQPIPGTDLCLGVDEYSPSVFVFNCNFTGADCGLVLMRYVPEGISEAQHDAQYPVKELLPPALMHRRQSRGFESVAVSPDGKRAIAIMQSAMGDEHGEQKHSHTLLSVVLDISAPLDATLQGTHILLAKNAHSFVGDARGSWTKARDIKVSAAVWVSHLMGRPQDPIVLILTRGINQVLAQAVDFTAATDVTSALKHDPLKFDSLGGHRKSHEALMRLGVIPAHTKTFFDSGDISAGGTSKIDGLPDGVSWSDKQEGMVIINNCTIAFGNDNDFVTASELWVFQLNTCLTDGMRTAVQSPRALLMRVLVVVVLALALTGALFYYGTRAADRMGERVALLESEQP